MPLFTGIVDSLHPSVPVSTLSFTIAMCYLCLTISERIASSSGLHHCVTSTVSSHYL